MNGPRKASGQTPQSVCHTTFCVPNLQFRAAKEVNNKYDGTATAARAAVQSIEWAINSATRSAREATAELTRMLVEVHWWILTIGAVVMFFLGWISKSYFR
jgi:hypothetical protein